jgi:hypothetical protein
MVYFVIDSKKELLKIHYREAYHHEYLHLHKPKVTNITYFPINQSGNSIFCPVIGIST